MLPPGPPRSGWVQQVAGANRRWRLPFRYRGSRRESAVAQLFSLGHIRTMSTKHETPILTRVLYVFGVATIIIGVISGGVICAESLSTGITIIIGSIFAGIIYIGIGQAVDFLARTAFSTDRLCTILETSITERLRAIESSSSAAPVAPTLAGSSARYYYSTNGEQTGPVDATDLRMMRKDGLVTDDTAVLREGETAWRKFRDYLALSR